MKIRNLFSILIVVLVLVLMINVVFAQSVKDKDIYLKSRTISSKEKTKVSTLDDIKKLNGKKHFIISFSEPPKEIVIFIV